MKHLLSAVLACSFVGLAAAAPRELVKQWETKPELKTPESVLLDAAAGVLYVSNIDGKDPWKKDDRGSIAKVGLDGRILAAEWVGGLQAPKGMALHEGKLYVADIDTVAVIDVAKAAIVQRIDMGAVKALNDVTVDQDGVVYVSDSGRKRVHQIREGKQSVVLENLKGPNGVLAVDGTLYLLDDGTLYRVEKDRQLTRIVDGLEGHTDGIERVGPGEFIVSCWRGRIYHVQAGEKQLLLETESKGIEAADIGYDAKHRIVYVPTFFTNTVAAYQLK